MGGLTEADLRNRANSWLVNIPAQKSRTLKIRFAAGNPVAATALLHDTDGRLVPIDVHAAIEPYACDAFSPASHGTIHAVLEMDRMDAELQLDRAWVETYSGEELVDLAPYQQETAARLAQTPDLITRTYKRMV